MSTEDDTYNRLKHGLCAYCDKNPSLGDHTCPYMVIGLGVKADNEDAICNCCISCHDGCMKDIDGRG